MTPKRQLTLDFDHRTALGFDDFLVTTANNQAVDWLDQYDDWPGGVLLMTGPAGCGKSHLSAVFCQATGAEYISGTELDQCKGVGFVSRFFVFEDCDQGLTPVREEALLHLFNSVRERNARLLLTAKSPPSRWNIGLKDLSSRLNTVTQVPIHEPDDALMTALLVKLFSDRQLKIDTPVIDYIIKRIERSFQAVRTLVDRLDRRAMETHRNISVQFVGQIMRELDPTTQENGYGAGTNG